MKPALTEEQKKRFEEAFTAIVAKAPLDVQKLWNGEISWVGDMPQFANNVHLKFKGRPAFEYVDLREKLMERTL
ncbi:hypothetical protein ACTHGU_21340 [Chitinophagaceae bacterium MMS25-I14]